MGNESDVVMKRKGCIKTTREDWIVRSGKGGVISISKRRPSDGQREANRLREQYRRRVANKIYAGLRSARQVPPPKEPGPTGRQKDLHRTAEHGMFRLPKHPDWNDILNALCDEAGYKVAEDGSVSCKNLSSYREPRDGNTAILEQASINTNLWLSYEIEVQPETQEEELSLDLTMSYK